jgi:hypothetical protein
MVVVPSTHVLLDERGARSAVQVRPVFTDLEALKAYLISYAAQPRSCAASSDQRAGQSNIAGLRRLRTDEVDVPALHRTAVEEVVRGDIIPALERVFATLAKISVCILRLPATRVTSADMF